MLTKYHVDSIKSHADSLQKEIEAAYEEIARLKADLVGATVQPFVKSPWDSLYDIKGCGSPELARKKLKELYDSSKPIEAENQKIAESNKKIFDRVVTILLGVGFKKEVVKYNRFDKRKESEAPWYTELKNQVPLYYRNCLDENYELACQNVDKWEKSLAEAEEIKKKEAAKEQAAMVKIKNLALLAHKYGLTVKEGPYDVLMEILDRDKYLQTAYWLEQFRFCWDDDPDIARNAVAGFKNSKGPKGPHDDAIIAELTELIQNWDGDGRVFRDCTWNYNRLYQLADPELLTDLRLLLASCHENELH